MLLYVLQAEMYEGLVLQEGRRQAAASGPGMPAGGGLDCDDDELGPFLLFHGQARRRSKKLLPPIAQASRREATG